MNVDYHITLHICGGFFKLGPLLKVFRYITGTSYLFEVSILDVIFYVFLARFNVKKKCIRLIGINLTRKYCSYFIYSHLWHFFLEPFTEHKAVYLEH